MDETGLSDAPHERRPRGEEQLTAELIQAAQNAPERLSQQDVDRILGVVDDES